MSLLCAIHLREKQTDAIGIHQNPKIQSQEEIEQHPTKGTIAPPCAMRVFSPAKNVAKIFKRSVVAFGGLEDIRRRARGGQKRRGCRQLFLAHIIISNTRDRLESGVCAWTKEKVVPLLQSRSNSIGCGMLHSVYGFIPCYVNEKPMPGSKKLLGQSFRLVK